MTLAELYEIGKTSRSATGSLKRASAAAASSSLNGNAGRRRKPLVVEVADDDDDEREKAAEKGLVGGGGTTNRADHVPTGGGATEEETVYSPKKRPTCMICRERESRYNCPNCNIAYCSLPCYQDTSRHATCSQAFLRDTLQTELGRGRKDGNGDGGGVQVDEGERKAMMDLLRRFNMSEEGGNLDADVEGDEEGGDIEREVLLGDHPEIDLDQASLQQLMSLLSDEERSVFEAAVNDSSQSKAKALMERLMRQGEEENVEGGEQLNAATSTFGKPWWSSMNGTNNSSSPVERVSVSDVYDSAVKLSQQPRRQAGQGKMVVRLEYNIIGILLGYALVVRHLDVECLSELVTPPRRPTSDASGGQQGAHDAIFDDMPPLESPDDQIEDDQAPLSDEERDAMRSIAKAKCTHLLPYLQAVGAESKMVLDSPEDATLTIAARMDNSVGTAGGAAATLHFLYKDVLAIVSSPKIVEMISTAASSTPTSREDRVAIVLCDMSLLFDAPVQRKLLFYAAYWLRLDVDAKRKIEAMITAESDRIQKEIDRGEDEERFDAAYQASEHQIGLP